MKIIGGTFKGRNFYMPIGIRPTQSIIRKALFDVLGRDQVGAIWLDLFAGSGAVGLEALSNGAARVVFVEKDAKCAGVIAQNISLLTDPAAGEHQPVCEVIQSDAFAVVKALARQGKKFDAVFIDPPYDGWLSKKALKALEAYDILQPNCTVIIQHEKRETLPEREGRFLLFRKKKYGASLLSLYKTEGQDPGRGTEPDS